MDEVFLCSLAKILSQDSGCCVFELSMRYTLIMFRMIQLSGRCEIGNFESTDTLSKMTGVAS